MLLGVLLTIEFGADVLGDLAHLGITFLVGSLDGHHEKVVVVHGDDAGSLAGLVVEDPAGHFLGMADGTVGICALVDGHGAGIDAGGVTGGFVVFILAGAADSQDIGLVVNLGVGFLAGKGGFLEHGHLLLGNGFGGLGDLHDMRTVNGVDNVRLADGGGKNRLEAGDHGVLGHPAEVALLAVGGIALIQGIERGQGGEVVLAKHAQEAVGQVAGIGALQHDVAHIHGIRNVAGFHDAGGIEGFAGLEDRGDAAVVLGHEGVDVAVHAAEVSALVPGVGPLAVAVALQEGTHVLCGGELVVQGYEFCVLGLDVLGGRSNLINGVFDVAGGLLAEVVFVGVVELLNVGRGNDDGAVHRIVGVGHHHEADVGGGVVLGHGVLALQGVHIGGGVEQADVLFVVAVAADGVLQIVAEQDAAAGFVVGDILHEVTDEGGREVAVLVQEKTGRSDDRGDILSDEHVDLFLLTYLEAGLLNGGNHQVAVHEVVPGHFTGLALSLLAGSGLAGEHFAHVGKSLHFLLKILVGDGFAIDFADIVLGRSGLDGLDDVGRVYKEE